MKLKYNYHGLYRFDVERVSLLGWVNGFGAFHQSLGSQMDFRLLEWTRKFKTFVGWTKEKRLKGHEKTRKTNENKKGNRRFRQE